MLPEMTTVLSAGNFLESGKRVVIMKMHFTESSNNLVIFYLFQKLGSTYINC